MALKILVTGDIHIGKRSSAVPENDPFFSARHTWENIVNYAVDHHLDAVMLTGDIIERSNRFFEATAPLEAGLDTLNKNNIRVFMIAGNHDYDVLQSVVEMKEREHVYLLGKAGKWESKPLVKEGEAVQVLGWSFPAEHYTGNPVDQLDLNLIDPSATTLALLHGDLLNPMGNYAPLSCAQQKNVMGIAAWLLGHIHKSGTYNENNPLILYPGSPQAFSPKEQGEHGISILTIENKAISIEKIVLSPVQYITIDIRFSPNIKEEHIQTHIYRQLQGSFDEIRVNDYLKAVVADVRLEGSSPFTEKIAAITQEITDYEGSFPFKVSIRTVSNAVLPEVPVKELLNDPSYIGVLAKMIDDIQNDRVSPLLTQIIEEWKERYAQAFTGSIYGALKTAASKEEMEALAKSYILEESRQLISTLYKQKTHAD